MTGLSMNGAAIRVCVRSPSVQYKKSASFIDGQEKSDASSEVNELNFNNNLSKSEFECGNRVMVVVDSSPEAKGALEWALSHAVQANDTIILLHATKKDENYNGDINQRTYELLHSMKNKCQLRKPEVIIAENNRHNSTINDRSTSLEENELSAAIGTAESLNNATQSVAEKKHGPPTIGDMVHVEIAIREGKEKGKIIVEEAKHRRVLLLVLGQRKRTIIWRLQRFWSTELRKKNRVVDYCIQNANCMTVAVRRKNKKYGGYLITTKSHKNFWLLA